MSFSWVLKTLAVVSLAAAGANAQSSDSEPPKVTKEDDRAYGVLANYRTAELSDPYAPISIREKFTIARKDTLDWPSYFVAGVFAGISQVGNSNPSFGQGVKGFAHRYGTSVVDQATANYLTEAVLPSLLRQDPRYFRKGTGSAMSRINWAASRVLVARNDSGKWRFNTSEVLGNGMVAAMGNAYYPDQRGFSQTMQRMASQIATDALSQLLKEFWPDLKNKMEQRKKRSAVPVK